MQVYDVPQNYNQSFYVPINGVSVQFSAYYLPLNGWLLDMDKIKGIMATPLLPIFKQYGYPHIIILSDNDVIAREDRFQIGIMTDSELDDYETALIETSDV